MNNPRRRHSTPPGAAARILKLVALVIGLTYFAALVVEGLFGLTPESITLMVIASVVLSIIWFQENK